ncbi:MAG: HesA/MoeB/ThiF family protein [Planctomycetota bacterium]
MSVLIVGAGGLGSPVAAILKTAGVADLTVVDPDAVELENLHRQILFHDADIGRAKADVVAQRLAVTTRRMRVDAANGRELLAGFDCVVDGTDSFATKFLLNDLALDVGVPLVHAAAAAFRGQVLVVRRGGPCLRCLLPIPPDAATDECSTTGILGPAAGTVAALAAAQVLRVLGDEPVGGAVLFADLATGRLHESRLDPRPDCRCRVRHGRA